MLQSRVISKASFTFVSIREFVVLCQSSVVFNFKGFWGGSLLNVPLSLSRGTIFRRQKNPRRGYRPKITGILFVCNEPGRSIAYCAHMMLW